MSAEEADLRLDRWLRRHYPSLGHGRLQKLLRTGQVRVDGRRAQGQLRLAPGQTVRIPPLPALPEAMIARPARSQDASRLRPLVLFEDDALLVLNKPPGLAVQGGTGTTQHVDAMLADLVGGEERPRLVHRLDRDTSGLLVIAKTAAAATGLTQAFRRHEVDKLYWALVAGRPAEIAGLVDQPLAKQVAAHGERMAPDEAGRRARTLYRVVARAGKVASWLALKPLTGRTHQLRVHCLALGTPILGDGKYGGAAARVPGVPKGLMLHARELRLPHPQGGTLALVAPLSDPLKAGFAHLGFEPDPSLPGASLADFDPA